MPVSQTTKIRRLLDRTCIFVFIAKLKRTYNSSRLGYKRMWRTKPDYTPLLQESSSSRRRTETADTRCKRRWRRSPWWSVAVCLWQQLRCPVSGLVPPKFKPSPRSTSRGWVRLIYISFRLFADWLVGWLVSRLIDWMANYLGLTECLSPVLKWDSAASVLGPAV